MNGELEIVTYPPYARPKQEGPKSGSWTGSGLAFAFLWFVFPPFAIFLGTMALIERYQLRKARKHWQHHQDELIKAHAVTEAESITAEAA